MRFVRFLMKPASFHQSKESPMSALACPSPNSSAVEKPTSSNAEKAVRLLIDVWQNGQYEVLPEIVHKDFERHHERAGAKGIEECATAIRQYRQGFPDLKYTIRHTTETEDRVSLLYDVEGTHLGDFLGIPKTGVKDKLTCCDFVIFEDGLIRHVWTYFDELRMMQKMKVIRVRYTALIRILWNRLRNKFTR